MHEEEACFWVRLRRYFPTPAHSCDNTASSTFKLRHPDSPLNLYHPAEPSHVVKSDLSKIALWGLTLIMHIGESTHVSNQTMHLPGVLGPKLLSNNLIFFHTETPLAACLPCTADPGLGNLSCALKCQLGAAQIPKAIWGVYEVPCSLFPLSLVPYSSSW